MLAIKNVPIITEREQHLQLYYMAASLGVRILIRKINENKKNNNTKNEYESVTIPAEEPVSGSGVFSTSRFCTGR